MKYVLPGLLVTLALTAFMCTSMAGAALVELRELAAGLPGRRN